MQESSFPIRQTDVQGQNFMYETSANKVPSRKTRSKVSATSGIHSSPRLKETQTCQPRSRENTHHLSSPPPWIHSKWIQTSNYPTSILKKNAHVSYLYKNLLIYAICFGCNCLLKKLSNISIPFDRHVSPHMELVVTLDEWEKQKHPAPTEPSSRRQ